MSTQRRVARPISKPAPSGTSIVTDPLEIRRLLLRGTQARTPASLKNRGGDIMLSTRLIDIDPKSGEIHLEFGKTARELTAVGLEKISKSAQSRECMILIYLPGRSIVGLNAEPKEIRKDRLVIEVPSRLFKIQRRKDVRFEIPQGYEYTIEFESLEQARTRVKKRVLDLSEGGLSFYILSSREAGLFRRGLVIPRCLLRIQNQEIRMSVVVRNRSTREERSSGNKIGVEFEEISNTDRDYLAQFVYSHAQHLFY